MAANGTSEAACEYHTEELNQSDTDSNAGEHHTNVLHVNNQFSKTSLRVEVGRVLGAGRDDAVIDLLGGAARARYGQTVIGPVGRTVYTAALQVCLYDINSLLDVLVYRILSNGSVQVAHNRIFQVRMLHVTSDAHSQFSHEYDQEEY